MRKQTSEKRVLTVNRMCISNNLSVLPVQSIIMPVYNASCWLEECLQAVLQQDFTGTMQLSVFDDASTVSVSHTQTWT